MERRGYVSDIVPYYGGRYMAEPRIEYQSAPMVEYMPRSREYTSR